MAYDYFFNLSVKTDPTTTEEYTMRYHALVKEGNKKGADDLRDGWRQQASRVSIPVPNGEVWEKIAKPQVALNLLPEGSFFIQFTFTLAKAYLSKDDRSLYIIDNPIIREKVFNLPFIRPTSWKGSLYSALWQQGYTREEDARLQRLFGEIRGEDSGRAGRLFFYPTFFTQVGLEVINPHDRQRRVGKNPILLECVPAGAKGIFSLLYVPFDRIGEDPSETRAQVLADLDCVVQGLEAMFLTYGFSAKRTSGYGTAKDEITDLVIATRAQGFSKNQTTFSQLKQEVENVRF